MASAAVSPLVAYSGQHGQRSLLVAPPRRATVLLVDDDADTRLLVRCLLGRTGRFEVVGEAETGIDGIHRASAARPDFIVLDVQMPGMSGLDALPMILEASPDSKVIVLSGLDASRIAHVAETRGATAVLEKGYDCSSVVPTLLALEGNLQGDLGGPRAPWDDA